MSTTFNSKVITMALAAASLPIEDVISVEVSGARIESGTNGPRLVNPSATVLLLAGGRLDQACYKRVVRQSGPTFISWPTVRQEEAAAEAKRELAYAVFDELVGRVDPKASQEANAEALFGDLSRMGHKDPELLFEQFKGVLTAPAGNRNYQKVAMLTSICDHRALYVDRNSENETPFGVFALVRALYNECDGDGKWLTTTTVDEAGTERETPVWTGPAGAKAWELARAWRHNESDVSDRSLTADEKMLCGYLFRDVAAEHDALAATPEIVAQQQSRGQRRAAVPTQSAQSGQRVAIADLADLAAALQ